MRNYAWGRMVGTVTESIQMTKKKTTKKKKANKKAKNNSNKKANNKKEAKPMRDVSKYLKVLILALDGVTSLFINDDDQPQKLKDPDIKPDDLIKMITSWAATDKGPMVQVQDIKFSPTKRIIVIARKGMVQTPRSPQLINMDNMPENADPCEACDRGDGPTGHFPKKDGSVGPCFNCVDPALPWGSPTRGLGWIGPVKAQMNANRKARLEARTNPQQDQQGNVTDMTYGDEDLAVEPVFS